MNEETVNGVVAKLGGLIVDLKYQVVDLRDAILEQDAKETILARVDTILELIRG